MTVKELIQKLEACTDKEQEVIIENNEYSYYVKDVQLGDDFAYVCYDENDNKYRKCVKKILEEFEYEPTNAYISGNEIFLLPKYMNEEISRLTDLFIEYYDLLSHWNKEKKEEVTYSQVFFSALLYGQDEMKRKIKTVKKCLENEKVSQ